MQGYQAINNGNKSSADVGDFLNPGGSGVFPDQTNAQSGQNAVEKAENSRLSERCRPHRAA
jgi:hypothetical protein